MSKNDDIEEQRGQEQDRAAGKASSLPRMQLIAAAVAACMCVALIGVSAWTLATKRPASSGADSAKDALEQVATPAGNDELEDDSKEPSSEATGEGSKGEEGSAGKKDTSGRTGSAGDRQGSGAAGSSTNGGSGGSSSESTGSDAAGGQSPNGGGSAGGAPELGQDESKTVSVTISADGSQGGGGVAGPITLTFEEGATVYDALASAGWSAQASWGAFGAYVTSINGVAADAQTGWTYTVNGSMPSTACSSYKLADGDIVVWTFVKVK